MAARPTGTRSGTHQISDTSRQTDTQIRAGATVKVRADPKHHVADDVSGRCVVTPWLIDGCSCIVRGNETITILSKQPDRAGATISVRAPRFRRDRVGDSHTCTRSLRRACSVAANWYT